MNFQMKIHDGLFEWVVRTCTFNRRKTTMSGRTPCFSICLFTSNSFVTTKIVLPISSPYDRSSEAIFWKYFNLWDSKMGYFSSFLLSSVPLISSLSIVFKLSAIDLSNITLIRLEMWTYAFT